jgi:SAM-dependent methyltransferase
VCGGKDDVIVAEIDRYGLPFTTLLCTACGTLRTNPYLDDASLDQFYRNDYQTMYARVPQPTAYFDRQRTYGARIFAHYQHSLPPNANVLELGCGCGGGLATFQERGYRVAGCELDLDLISFGSARGLPDLWHGSVAEMPPALADRRWNLIFLHHVFEHVSSPLELIQSLARLTAPGGRILAIVPDPSRIDRFSNPGGDLLRFLHVAHKFNYTTAGLLAVAARAGMNAVAVNPPRDLETAWSEMPELWMEFCPASAPAESIAPFGMGHAMLAYLQETERRFLSGSMINQFPCQQRAAAPDYNSVGLGRRRLSRLWKWLRRRPTQAA